jgi:DNA polymerase-3 subunit delta'
VFSEVLGQERAKSILQRMISRGKIPHAFLFTGIKGIGKTTTARAFTAALSCRAPRNGDACGDCAACRQLRHGNFPDYLEIHPDGQVTKIHQIRELNRQMCFAPVTGPYRVCVIQSAESMNEEAANSFLKTLEEPPPQNILILNATEPLNLRPTIVSRCQRVAFQPLPREESAAWLSSRCEISLEAARVIVRLAGGSLGQALRIAETEFLSRRREWIERLIRLPGLGGEILVENADSIAKKERSESVLAAGEGNTAVFDMLAVWASWCRDLLVTKTGQGDALLINDDCTAELSRWAPRQDRETLNRAVFAVDRGLQDLRRNRNPTVVLQQVMLRLQEFLGGDDARQPARPGP